MSFDTGPILRRVHTGASRAAGLGTVLPRAVAGARATARRDAADPIPSHRPGWRDVGEAATDELFIELSGWRRPRPSATTISDSVDACRVAADSLNGVDVASAHRHPGPLLARSTRRSASGRIAHESIRFDSDPDLPPALTAYAGVQDAFVRVVRHDDRPRPWLIAVHGAGQGRREDLLAFRAKHLHHDLGYNLALPVLPNHGQRLDSDVAWPGFDLLGNVALMMRAVSDVRALVGWVGEQQATSVTVLGMSLGGPVAALTASLEPTVEAVVAMVPMLDANATIAHHLARRGERGRRMQALVRDDAVRAVSVLVDPLALTPYAEPERRLVIGAHHDRLTSARVASRLQQHWGGQVFWHGGGHVGHLLSGRVFGALDEFLAQPPTR
jgi:pimeloyl-ACP methyl ester carboxylesterase